jgi:putative transposase
MEKKINYWTGAHTKHKLRYHIVWVPKYRKRILIGKLLIRLEELLYQASEINNWRIEELSIQRDHIHILIQVKPDKALSYIVQILKGGMSRILRKQFPDLDEFLWRDSFWADGYFAETVGVLDEQMIRKYIREQ